MHQDAKRVVRVCQTRVSAGWSADSFAFQIIEPFAHLDLRVQIGQEGGGGGGGDVTHDVRVVEHVADLVEQALGRLRERQTKRSTKRKKTRGRT